MDWQELEELKSPEMSKPHAFFIWACIFSTIVLMVVVKLKRRKMFVQERYSTKHVPKNLESILLNLSLLVLILTNQLGYVFFTTRYVIKKLGSRIVST